MAGDERLEGRELTRLVEALSQVLAFGPQVVALARRVMGEARGRSVGRGYSREVRRAVFYIEAHYEEDIDLDRLARVAGCSRSCLTRAFRRETGETARGWLRRVRMAHAALGVEAGDKVEAVMLGVGYRGKRNFYQQFKARFGTTPGLYRGRGCLSAAAVGGMGRGSDAAHRADEIDQSNQVDQVERADRVAEVVQVARVDQEVRRVFTGLA